MDIKNATVEQLCDELKNRCETATLAPEGVQSQLGNLRTRWCCLEW